MTHTQVAQGVHLIEHAYVNCYVIEDNDGLTLVDTGLPSVWRELGTTIRDLGRSPSDVRAVVLTHAHFDHVGTARRLQRRLDVAIMAHADELHLAGHPYSYDHEKPVAPYPLRHPRAVPIMMRMVGAGMLRVRGVRGLRPFTPGEVLPVPGRPRVILSAGHTAGHCALHLPERDVLFSGDALVTLDPYTALTGPRIVAGAATADSGLALRSLDELAATGAATVLPGHGDPWTDGIARAAQLARDAGVA